MRYRQLGQSWTSATLVNLVLLGLLLAIVCLYLIVTLKEVTSHVCKSMCRMWRGHWNLPTLRHSRHRHRYLR
jgi:hypothetical protein